MQSKNIFKSKDFVVYEIEKKKSSTMFIVRRFCEINIFKTKDIWLMKLKHKFFNYIHNYKIM